MQIVVVTGRGVDYAIAPVVEGLRRQGHEVLTYPDAASLAASPGALAGADLLYGSGLRIDAALLEQAPRLRAVVTPWIGIDGFDLASATASGVLVANGQVPENYLSMAEATIMVILACLYNLSEKIDAMRANLAPPPRRQARMLRGKTLGMIGFGNMARAIVARLAGWDVAIQTYTPRLRTPLPEGVTRVELDALLATSDIVCVLATLNAETRGLLTHEKLRSMKPGAILVNTARGGIADERALAEIAQEGRLHKIALDVFETEPLPAESALRCAPHMILTPHCVGHTREGAEAVPVVALESITRALAGKAPLYVVNREALAAWQRRWQG